jgi:hypothetical protein
MPISKDRFQDISDDETEGARPGTNAAAILKFLREHPEKAFTQSEIAAATDVKTGSVGPTLVRLRERGRVDHRGTYWRISDHDRSVEAATDHAGATLADREGEGETPTYEGWQAHAVDPREGSDE